MSKKDSEGWSPWIDGFAMGLVVLGMALALHGEVQAAAIPDLYTALAADTARPGMVLSAGADMMEQIEGALNPQTVQERMGQMLVQPDENKGVEGAAGPGLSPEETPVTRVEDYFGFGPAIKTAVACYTREFDTKAVKPPEKTVAFRDNPSAERNGVASQFLQIHNLVLSDCQMRQVKLLKQKYPAFYEATLTLLYKRADGVTGTLVVEERIGATINGYSQDFRPGAFPIYPGDLVAINVLTVPSGSEKAHQKWLEGGDTEFRLLIGDFTSQPCTSAEIRRMIKSQTRVDLGNAKTAVGMYRSESG